jgi:hypothetical protein
LPDVERASPYSLSPGRRRRRNSAVAENERHIEVAEQLDGIHPGFKASAFISKKPRMFANRIEKLPGTRGAGEFVFTDLHRIGRLGVW